MATACKLAGMPARDRRVLLTGAVATSALLVVAAVAGQTDLLVYGAPLFLLAVPLLAGRYVGEERLERLRGHTRRTRRRMPAAARPAVRRWVALLPRGGRLIAEALAVRPPPALAVS